MVDLVPNVPPGEVGPQREACRVDFFARHDGPCTCPPPPVVHRAEDGTHWQHPPGVPCRYCREAEEVAAGLRAEKPGAPMSGEPPAAVEGGDPVRAAVVAERDRCQAAHERAGDDVARLERELAEARARRHNAWRRATALDDLLTTWGDTETVED